MATPCLADRRRVPLDEGAHLPREWLQEKLQALLAWDRCAFHLEQFSSSSQDGRTDPMSIQEGDLSLWSLSQMERKSHRADHVPPSGVCTQICAADLEK